MGEVERMARLADEWGAIGQEQVEQMRERAGSPRWRAFAFLMEEIMGIPRHISQHSGGMVISTRPLVELVPVIPAAMEGRQICQWDKDSCADAGFLKIDLLGLGMLSAVEECVDLIAAVRGAPIDLSRVGFDDPEVYAEIQQADTVGVFQIESRAQMQSLHQTLPENLDDLTVQVALVRPGPIVGDAVNPYVKHRRARRADPGFEPPYDHPLLEPVLHDTLGVVVFQDQVLEVAIALAGFSTGEAESLRRAMSRKRSRDALERHRQRFRAGAAARGVPEATAMRVFEKVVAFSEFGFPKSHAAAFAILAYQSAWLHRSLPGRVPVRAPERPADGLLPAGDAASRRRAAGRRDPPAGREPKRRGLHRRGRRRGRCGSASATSRASAPGPRDVIAEREAEGAFSDLGELVRRAPLALGPARGADPRRRLRRLRPQPPPAPVGAAPAPRPRGAGGRRAAGAGAGRLPHPGAAAHVRLGADGGRPRGHEPDHRPPPDGAPAAEPRRRDPHLRPAPARSARAGHHRRHHHRPPAPGTAKGIVFLLVEDECGMTNVICPPAVYERDRIAVRAEPLVQVWGRLERRDGAVNVIADRVAGLTYAGRPDLGRAAERAAARAAGTGAGPGRPRRRPAPAASRRPACEQLRPRPALTPSSQPGRQWCVFPKNSVKRTAARGGISVGWVSRCGFAAEGRRSPP